MKKLSFILIVVFFSFKTIGQNAYYDAIKLAALNPKEFEGKLFFTTENRLAAAKILKKYTKGEQYSDIAKEFDKNAFISLSKDNLQSNTTVDGDESTTISASIGGLDVTKFADGLAKFLVKRTKEELNIAFFRKLKKALAEYPEFRALFPRTNDFIKLIEEQNYASMMQVLKQAFQNDVENLMGNIPDLRNLKCPSGDNACAARIKKLKDFFSKEAGHSVWMASLFIDQVIGGENVADALDAVFDDADLAKANKGDTISVVYNSVKVLNLFSGSLRNEDADQIWVSADKIKSGLIENDLQQKIYLGILYQQSKTQSIRFPRTGTNGKELYFHDLLGKVNTEGSSINPFLKSLVDSMDKIESNMEAINDATGQGKSNNLANLNSYLSGISGLFQSISDLMEILNEVTENKELAAVKKEIDTFNNNLPYAIHVISDLQNKNYGALIFDATIYLDFYMSEDEFGFKDQLVKYGTFIATVAQAENSDQVADAIEAAVLPSGSSSIKRKSNFNVALNAYVGPRWGREELGDDGDYVLGMTAPVGISTSFGKIEKFLFFEKFPVQGVTIFMSVVDVGALTTYRFDDDNADGEEGLPEVSLKNILAPGGHVYLNFRNCPISLGGGLQFGPSLRKIDADTEAHGYSYHATLLVDIPLINLFTSSR